MAKILYDRYAHVTQQSIPGDNVTHVVPVYPGDDCVLLGAFASLDILDSMVGQWDYRPVGIKTDGPENNIAVFLPRWDDGQGGAGDPATLHIRAFFAKTYEIFP